MTTEYEFNMEDIDIHSDEFKETMIDLAVLVSIMNPKHDMTIYTDKKPVMEKVIEESPIIMNLYKMEKKLKTKFDSATRKLISNIIYTKLKEMLSEIQLSNSFRKNMRQLSFHSEQKVLYPY